jgi:protein-S-isoprenylcysteine O-methyltransferase Ste14
MEMTKTFIGKFLYGAFFCIILPLILFFWSKEVSITLPLGHWTGLGIFAVVIGAFFMLLGMIHLLKYGQGLPMNAFPPIKYVNNGAYSFLKHPIYVGFCILLGGISVLLKSPSGFYVITPIMMLLCWALVWGFEKHDLQTRFGVVSHQVLFGLPEQSDKPATSIEKFSAIISAFLPWWLGYSIVLHLGVFKGSVNTMLPFEQSWPVLEWMEIPYATTYLFVGVCPLLLKSRNDLRDFLQLTWLSAAIGIFLQIVLPFYAAPRSFTPQGSLGELILFERFLDGPAASFPSFHVIWALIARVVWNKVFPAGAAIWNVITFLIIISCVAIGVHSLLDVSAGILVFFLTQNHQQTYKAINKISEKLANSWSEKRIGGFRVINHSFYAGAAAMIGVIIMATFSVSLISILIITSMAALGGIVWGQLVEGSSKLLRPFGYFGALLGGFIGVFFSWFFVDESFFATTGACAIASPIVQAVGRIRCLIQGCCHGREQFDGQGIHYYNDHSRVCKISGMHGKLIHNTQVYSMFANILIFLFLLRLWFGNAPSEMLTGLYLIFAGATRFVEEAYRGEVQTKKIQGLKFYQWLSIVSVVAGITLTVLPQVTALSFNPFFDLNLLFTTIIAGFTWAFAMGMDFPRASFRFSRLSD